MAWGVVRAATGALWGHLLTVARLGVTVDLRRAPGLPALGACLLFPATRTPLSTPFLAFGTRRRAGVGGAAGGGTELDVAAP